MRFPTEIFGLSLFSLPHLSFIIVTVCFVAIGLYVNVNNKFTKQQYKLEYDILAVIVLVIVFINRVVAVRKNDNLWYLIPDSICSFSAICLALGTLFLPSDLAFFQVVPMVMIIGGLANVFFPGYIGESDSIFYPNTITGLLYHVVAMYLALVMFVNKYIQMNIWKWWVIPIGLFIYIAYGLIIIHLTPLNDAMNIEIPLIPNTDITGPFALLFCGGIYIYFALVSISYKYHIAKLVQMTLLKPIRLNIISRHIK